MFQKHSKRYQTVNVESAETLESVHSEDADNCRPGRRFESELNITRATAAPIADVSQENRSDQAKQS